MNRRIILKYIGVTYMAVALMCANVPFGALEFLLQKWAQRNIVDAYWLAQHDASVKDIFIPRAHAAETAVDGTVNTTVNRHQKSAKHIVCVDDTDCYAFYIDSDNDAVYQKSTDGGASWGGTGTDISALTYQGIAVWYDRWTPGDTGNYIHIAMIETDAGTPDRIWYSRFDTTDDSFSTIVDASGAANGVLAALNDVTITKGTNGDLYVGTVDATAPTAGANFVEKCDVIDDCTTAGGWDAAGSTNPWDNAGGDTDGVHSLILLPLSDTTAHDSGDIMLVSYDVGGSVVEYKVYDESANTWGTNFATIESATDNTTYPHALGGAADLTTGDLYITYVQTPGTANTSEVRAWKYSDGWSQLTDPWPDTTDGASIILDANIGIDANTSDLYIAYIRAAATAAANDVYYIVSTDDGSSWGSEQLLSDGTDGDHRGISLNATSDERLYAVWYDPTPDDIFGGLIADLTPSAGSSAPTVTTNYAGNVGAQSAQLFGAITDTGGEDATEHGFAYSTDANLSTGVATSTLGSYTGMGTFSTQLSGLTENETYFFRAYATNGQGTSYGSIQSFTTGNVTVTRKMRIFEGFLIKLVSGRIILHGS